MTVPLPIAVTGGIASGKSEVTRRFESLDVAVLDADVISRLLVEPGKPALEEIVCRFGSGVLDAQGRLDRRKLRGIVFKDAAARRDLEAILHPRVRAALREGARHAAGPYVVLAIPLLVESGHYDWIDRTLVVDVPRGLQIARLMLRDDIDHVAAEALLATQATREARLARATDVIVNDSTLTFLNQAIARLDQSFRLIASRHRRAAGR